MARFVIKDLKEDKFRGTKFEKVEERETNDEAHERAREMKDSGDVSDSVIVVMENED